MVTVGSNEHIEDIVIADWNWSCGGTAFQASQAGCRTPALKLFVVWPLKDNGSHRDGSRFSKEERETFTCRPVPASSPSPAGGTPFDDCRLVGVGKIEDAWSLEPPSSPG